MFVKDKSKWGNQLRWIDKSVLAPALAKQQELQKAAEQAKQKEEEK